MSSLLILEKIFTVMLLMNKKRENMDKITNESDSMLGDYMRNIAAFFSMLMPGFGQIYNRQFVKGVIFLITEHFDNAFGHINQAIYMD